MSGPPQMLDKAQQVPHLTKHLRFLQVRELRPREGIHLEIRILLVKRNSIVFLQVRNTSILSRKVSIHSQLRYSHSLTARRRPQRTTLLFPRTSQASQLLRVRT